MPLNPERFTANTEIGNRLLHAAEDAALRDQYTRAIRPLADRWQDLILTASGVSTMVGHGLFTVSLEEIDGLAALIFHTGALMGELYDLDDAHFYDLQLDKADEVLAAGDTMLDLFRAYLPHIAATERVMALLLDTDLPTLPLRHNVGEAGYFLSKMLNEIARTSLPLTAEIDQARASAEKIGRMDA